jgi:hypothetical protein
MKLLVQQRRGTPEFAYPLLLIGSNLRARVRLYSLAAVE